MRISDWSSDGCSSDLEAVTGARAAEELAGPAVGHHHDDTVVQVVGRVARHIGVAGRAHHHVVTGGDCCARVQPDGAHGWRREEDRTSVVEGKRVSVSGDLAGRRILNKTIKRIY